MKQLVWLLFLLCFTGCLENKTSSSGSPSYYEDQTYLGPQSIIRLYRLKATGLEFVTEFLPSGKKNIEIPKNILKTDTENRTKADVPAPMDLVLKIYNPEAPSPDFYFEAPVLASPVQPSNVTTALSWVLRWSFQGEVISFTKNDFDQLVGEIEIRCANCRQRTSSEVVQIILGDATLSQGILAQARQSNPALSLAGLRYQPPSAEYAYSTAILAGEGKAATEISETQSYKLELIYVNPLQSAQAQKPESWSHEFQQNLSVEATPDLSFSATYVDAGFHVFRPVFSSLTGVAFLLELTVNNKNRLPLCQTAQKILWQVNRINDLSLSTVCEDPDPEDGLLLFNAVTVPPGLTLSSDGVIKWLPTQFHYDQKSTWLFRFGVTDPQMGYSEYSLEIQLSPDQMPVLNFAGPSLQMTEGVSSIFHLSAVDADGDALYLRAVPETVLNVGLPVGSANMGDMIRSGSLGHYEWDWTFMPSYLQTVGSDGTFKVKFVVSYDPTDPRLDSSVVLTEQVVTFSVSNQDDPPLWQAGIAGFAAKENVPLVVQTTAFATDPNPHSTAVTYAVVPSMQNTCNWDPSRFSLSLVGGMIEITINPEYKSARECMFNLQATDATGLVAESSPFQVSIEDTNQPIMTKPGAPTLILGKERERVDLLIQDMFEDLDEVDGDDSEYYDWQCQYDSVPGHSADLDCYDKLSLFRPSLGRESLQGFYTPSSIAAGTYYVRLTVTDKGGTSATHDFQVIIDQAPGPQDLSLIYNGNPATDLVKVNEGTRSILTLNVAPPTADSIDLYDYVVMPGTCSVVGASGACPISLLTPNGGFSGQGNLNFDMEIAPNFNDGNNPFPATYRQYVYTFTVYKQDQSSLRSEITVMIQVDNVNRAPTNLKASGCTNCTLNDQDGESLSLTINAAADSKTGPNWKKNYGTVFSVVDADLNDLPTIEWSESSPLLGTLNEFVWNFKLPSCVNPSSTGSISRTLTMKAMDSRGAVFERPINLIIQKATASSSCLQ